MNGYIMLETRHKTRWYANGSLQNRVQSAKKVLSADAFRHYWMLSSVPM